MLNLKRAGLAVLLAGAVLMPWAAAANPANPQAPTAIIAYAAIPMFSTEAAAQRHCPSDHGALIKSIDTSLAIFLGKHVLS